MVRAQVESQARNPPSCLFMRTRRADLPPAASAQIKVRDFSSLNVSIAPADYTSWTAVRTELMSEKKAGLKARLEAECAAAADDEELAEIRTRFGAEERNIEHLVDHEVHTHFVHSERHTI